MRSQDFTKFKLPSVPGVYFFKQGKEILYIGKATHLRNRTRSYFAMDLIDTRGPGILDMVTKSDRIDWQETDSVLEALILEANLIKKYQPKYNSKEKDDKSFYQVIITNESWPRVMMVRSRDLKVTELTGRISRINFYGKIKYSFGPYPNGTSLREALKIIRKIFPFIDNSSVKKDQQEFYRQLQLTPRGGRNEYIKTINNLKLFFQGKKSKLMLELEKSMHHHAKRAEFEQAHIMKKRLFALQHINDVALIKRENEEPERVFRIESYDIAHISGVHSVGVMTVVTDGVVDKSEYKKFKIKGGAGNNDYQNLAEIVTRRFNHPEWRGADLIVVDGGVGQYNTIAKIFKTLSISIPIISVIKDDRHKPKGFHGHVDVIKKYKKEILLANSESHRFAISYHKQLRGKHFLK